MASDGVLNFETKIDEKGFNKGVKNISKSAKGLSGSIKAIGAAAIAAAAAVVTKKLTQIASQAIELASDVQEVQNVVDTAFGSMAYKVEEFADVAIEQFGMSKLAAKQTASTYMSMGKAMGLSMDAASDMAVEIAKLTGDVASFYNLSQDLAATKLKGIWTGETEGLKDLGVVMTEANLQQYALTQGTGKAYNAMSQAEKVTLRYSYVMDALADAQGDFAKTSDSWANQTRVLSETWKELLSIIGGGLIRVLTPVITVINRILAALVTLANTFAKTIGQLFGWNKEVTVSAGASVEAAEGQEELAGATADAGDAASGALASFDKLNVLQSDTGGSGAAAGASGPQVDIVDGETNLQDNTGVIDKLSKKVQELQPYVDRLRAAWDRLKTSFDNFWNSPGVQKIVGWVKELFDWTSTRLSASFILALAGAIDGISGALDILSGFINIVVSLITGDFNMAATGFRTMLDGMKNILRGFGTIVESVLIFALGHTAVEAMKTWLTNALNWFTQTKVYTTGIQTVFKGVITFLKGAFSKDWKLAWEGVTKIFKGIINTITSIVESGVNMIISAINWCINQINRIKINVPDWVTSLTGMGDFGFNIPNLNKVSIPKLATGAVIPPNSEFLAMLGDQKSGNNIEAPEGLIRQIVREESGNGDIIINAKGTMGQLIRMLKLEIDREDNRRGATFAPGGVY